MNVTVNGKKQSMDGDLTIRELLEMLGLKPGITIVERNGEIVDRDSYGAIRITDGDILELIRMVGGG